MTKLLALTPHGGDKLRLDSQLYVVLEDNDWQLVEMYRVSMDRNVKVKLN